MDNLFHDTAEVRTEVRELIATGKAVYNDLQRGQKMTLERAVELGKIINRLKAECGHGEFGQAVQQMGVPPKKASEYGNIANLPSREISQCNSISEALEIVRDRPEKPANPKWCDRCNRIGSQTKDCQACKDKASKKADARGQTQQPQMFTEKEEPKPAPGIAPAESAPETDDDPIAKAAEWMHKKAEAVVETIRKTRVVRRGVAEEALARLNAALDEVLKLAAEEVREPFTKACSKCGEEVLFAVTHNNRWMILNPEKDHGGSWEIMNRRAVLVERDGKTKYYKSHFNTCFPKSKETK